MPKPKVVRPSLLDAFKPQAPSPVIVDRQQPVAIFHGVGTPRVWPKAEGDYPHWADTLQREYIGYQRGQTKLKLVSMNFSEWYAQRKGSSGNNNTKHVKVSSKSIKR